MLDGCFGRALPLIADAQGRQLRKSIFPDCFQQRSSGSVRARSCNWQAIVGRLPRSCNPTGRQLSPIWMRRQDKILFVIRTAVSSALIPVANNFGRPQLPGREFSSHLPSPLCRRGASASFVVVRGQGSGNLFYALWAGGQDPDAWPCRVAGVPRRYCANFKDDPISL